MRYLILIGLSPIIFTASALLCLIIFIDVFKEASKEILQEF